MGKESLVKTRKSHWFNNVKIREIADHFSFTEGPVWHPDQYFLFSDTPANKIYQLFPDGKTSVFLDKSGLSHNNTEDLSDQVGSNGLSLGRDNRLYICQHGNHAIAVLNEKNEADMVISDYEELPFNSPNDLVFRSDGILYFTDPPYGLAGQVLHPGKFQPFAGIYKYDGSYVALVGKELQFPNGVCLSPDEQWLYVSSNHPAERYILKYKIAANGDAHYHGIFVKENADGIKTDRQGNIYLATGEGIVIVSEHGERIGLISLPGMVSNLAWGGREKKILCVTAGNAVYFIND